MIQSINSEFAASQLGKNKKYMLILAKIVVFFNCLIRSMDS